MTEPDYREEARLKAERAKNRLLANPSPELIETIVEWAQSEGFSDVWLEVFRGDAVMAKMLEDAEIK